MRLRDELDVPATMTRRDVPAAIPEHVLLLSEFSAARDAADYLGRPLVVTLPRCRCFRGVELQWHWSPSEAVRGEGERRLVRRSRQHQMRHEAFRGPYARVRRLSGGFRLEHRLLTLAPRRQPGPRNTTCEPVPRAKRQPDTPCPTDRTIRQMTKIATGRTQPDLVAAELGGWIERLEAALAPLAAGNGSDVARIDRLALTVRQGWAIDDRLPADPRGDQLILFLRRGNAVIAAVQDVLSSLRLVPDERRGGGRRVEGRARRPAAPPRWHPMADGAILCWRPDRLRCRVTTRAPTTPQARADKRSTGPYHHRPAEEPAMNDIYYSVTTAGRCSRASTCARTCATGAAGTPADHPRAEAEGVRRP
jgi:hypothetical protein